MEDQDQEWLAYQHSSGICTLEYPETWSIEEQASPNQYQIILRSEDGGVLFRLTIQPAKNEYSVSELENLTEQFLEANYASRIGYQLDSLDSQPEDESVWASYVYGEEPELIVGDLLYWVDDPYLLRLEVEQAEANADSTQMIVDDIINTLELEPDVSFNS